MTEPNGEKGRKDRTPRETLLIQQESALVQAVRNLVDTNKHDEALALLPRITGFPDQKIIPLINIGYARPDLRAQTAGLLKQELGKCVRVAQIFPIYSWLIKRHFPLAIRQEFESRLNELDPNWQVSYEAEMEKQNQQQRREWVKDPEQLDNTQECLVWGISVRPRSRAMKYFDRYLTLGGLETDERYLKARIEIERKFYKSGSGDLPKYLRMLIANAPKDQNLAWLRSVLKNRSWFKESPRFLVASSAIYIERYHDSLTIQDWNLFAKLSLDVKDSELGAICYNTMKRLPEGRDNKVFMRLNKQIQGGTFQRHSGTLANPVWENLEDRSPVNKPAAKITDWAHSRLLTT